MKKFTMLMVAALSVIAANAKTLIVYYSFTNNVHTVAMELQSQTGADILRIEPAEKGLDYEADNYAIGSMLISAIRSNPHDAASYPEIDPVNVNLDHYDVILIGAPLWWGNMAAPLQTYLFHNGSKMAGKKIGLIVSSASSGISGVEADAKRLIPDGDFLSPSLWIRSRQTSNCHALIERWLNQIGFSNLSGLDAVLTDSEPNICLTGNKLQVNGEFNTVVLHDLSGHKFVETTDNPIDISALASGIYIATVNQASRNYSKEIFIR